MVVLFGLIIGSFLNVYLYRFHTGRSLQGHSHCLSCATPLRWFELFPVVSYLALRGRCRTCGSRIPVRYALVEVLTAGLFLWLYIVFGPTIKLLPALGLGIILLLVTVYDLYHMIIPNEFVIAIMVLALLWFGVSHTLDITILPSLLAQLGAGVATAGFFGLLWFVSRGRWIGFGDVKLAFPLGFLVGLSGVFSLITLSFWIGALVSLGLIGVMRVRALIAQWLRQRTFPHRAIVNSTRYLTMKSEVPFAPFMIAAFLLVWLLHLQVLAFIASIMSV